MPKLNVNLPHHGPHIGGIRRIDTKYHFGFSPTVLVWFMENDITTPTSRIRWKDGQPGIVELDFETENQRMLFMMRWF